MSSGDNDRLQAILDAEERVRAEAEAEVLEAALAIVERMSDAIALWTRSDDDRAKGKLHLGELKDLIEVYEAGWKRRAMRALGAATQGSEHFTREDRQTITGKRVYGLRRSTTDAEGES